MKYSVVIPAAGQGKRMNAGKNKQFIMLEGKPIIVHTMSVFQSDPHCEEIVLAINEREHDDFRSLIEEYGLTKVSHVVTGGRERQQSVYEGLKALQGEKIVLIHDGARPFFSHEVANKVALAAANYDGAIVAVPVKDTVKQVDQLQVKRTIDRSSLWAVQTPQAFRLSVIKDVHQWAEENDVIGTDDASLVEMNGQAVHVIEGDYWNVKLTTPEDLIFARAILREKKESGI
ncbi:2-C-methyl-D-erythritol 4-phosphate cytidylyltransferase [Pseudalkalibacillus hwajinpoensis]|uniref:2-C-methyl-D-erythritol 4-phosphate cytidylyltransferase n=1 Tax=Guptibacillus hwajinpoensis TaxID=208199 RepID=UPI001CD4FE4C|nr:2-C-methyl-D-erythritol 4-phosphate cytidylyltransferase [Pseudalkalibacillus hwajinpoensis]MCA0993650.1 2-C-methyl-D-erythritol 4-phosphate cytidylyltransferase [Pseudalkalibacillus hwajinpoensis]